MNELPMDCENDSSNHRPESCAPKSLDDTADSTKDSPIAFHSLPCGRARNTNKTGKIPYDKRQFS